MNKNLKNRAQILQEKLQESQSILISAIGDIAYLSNFKFLVPEEREAFIFVTKNSFNLIHTSFAPINNLKFINYLKGSFPEELANHLKLIIEKENIKNLLIDPETLFVRELEAIKEKKLEVAINNYPKSLIQDLRSIKDIEEIEKISLACSITAKVMTDIIDELKEGITEIEVKKRISNLFELNNILDLAFPIIVAFGPNSALPHHQPGEKILQNNMTVLIDIGAKVSDYCADMTRTIWFGKQKSERFIEIESIVLQAYKEVINKMDDRKTSIKANDLDNAARTYIVSKGYGNQFIHTTGHGLGLSIHEPPSISWSNQTNIEPNMIITIEPGIYLNDEFGYRYENTVLVTKDGTKELTFESK